MKKNQKVHILGKKSPIKNQMVGVKIELDGHRESSLEYKYSRLISVAGRPQLEKYTEILPYRIPAIYSLKYEEMVINRMQKRTDAIHKAVIKKDFESIASDWKQVGGELYGAIRKCK